MTIIVKYPGTRICISHLHTFRVFSASFAIYIFVQTCINFCRLAFSVHLHSYDGMNVLDQWYLVSFEKYQQCSERCILSLSLFFSTLKYYFDYHHEVNVDARFRLDKICRLKNYARKLQSTAVFRDTIPAVGGLLEIDEELSPPNSSENKTGFFLASGDVQLVETPTEQSFIYYPAFISDGSCRRRYATRVDQRNSNTISELSFLLIGLRRKSVSSNCTIL